MDKRTSESAKSLKKNPPKPAKKEEVLQEMKLVPKERFMRDADFSQDIRSRHRRKS